MDDELRALLVVLVLGWALVLFKLWRHHVPSDGSGRLLSPSDAVRRDQVPPLPPVDIFSMQIDPSKPRDPSEQSFGYDRWLVSDLCDPQKLPAATVHEVVNEPAWRCDPSISERVEQLRNENRGKEKRRR